VFARIRYKGTNIILGIHEGFEGEQDYGHAPATSGITSPVAIYVYCDDLEARYQKALQAGLKVLAPLRKTFWSDTIFRVVDLDGLC